MIHWITLLSILMTFYLSLNFILWLSLWHFANLTERLSVNISQRTILSFIDSFYYFCFVLLCFAGLLVSISSILALNLIIYLHLLNFCIVSLHCSRIFKYPMKMLIWDLSISFCRHLVLLTWLLELPSIFLIVWHILHLISIKF